MRLFGVRTLLPALAFAVLVAAITAMPTSANTVTRVTCYGGSEAYPTTLSSTRTHVELSGSGWCLLPAGSRINGNVEIMGGARFVIAGRVNGNINAWSNHATYANSIIVRGSGLVVGNIHQRWTGNIVIGGEVTGNVTVHGTGHIQIGGFTPNIEVRVSGNVTNKGPGCVNVFSANGNNVRITGNVSSYSGLGQIQRLPWWYWYHQSCGWLDWYHGAVSSDGNSIRINGNVCGVLVDPGNRGGVTVNGIIDRWC